MWNIILIGFILHRLVIIDAITIDKIQTKNEESCDLPQEEFWSLAKWYFGSAQYVAIVEIEETYRDSSLLTKFVLEQCYRGLERSIVFRNQVYTTIDDNITYSQSISWQGRVFEKRVKPVNRSAIVNDISRKKRSIKFVNQNNNHILVPRRDEPQLGVLVLVDSVDLLDNYLFGAARYPFNNPKSNFILSISESKESFEESDQETNRFLTINRVMSKLWNDYAIVNVILISSCGFGLKKDSELIGFFDPFIRNNATSWGAMRWINLEILEDNNGWVLNKLRNFNMFPVHSSIFPRNPTAIKSKDLPFSFRKSILGATLYRSHSYGGLDGLVLGNLAKALNFDSKLIVSLDGTDYGYAVPNGTFIGSIGDVLYGRADISFNGRFIKNYGTNEIDFLFPVFFDQFCVIAPKALQIPQWMAIFQCYDNIVWASILLLNIVLGTIWYFLKQWAVRKRRLGFLNRKANERLCPEYERLHVIIIEMWLIMLAGPSNQLPIRGVERLFMTSCLLANIIIAGTFQGSLTTSYSTKSFYKDIDSLDDLDKSGLPIGTSSRSVLDIFGFNGTGLLGSLQSKFHIVIGNVSTRERAAYTRDICCVERKADVNLIIKTRFQTPDGTELLHVINECPRAYHLSYIARKDSPYISKFSMVLRRFSEAGLLNKWYRDTEESLITFKRIKNPPEDDGALKPFTFVDIQTAFYILFIGLAVCFLIFLIELFYRKKCCSKRINKNN